MSRCPAGANRCTGACAAPSGLTRIHCASIVSVSDGVIWTLPWAVSFSVTAAEPSGKVAVAAGVTNSTAPVSPVAGVTAKLTFAPEIG